MVRTANNLCHRCGGALVFLPGTTKMVCPYCGAENEIAGPAEASSEIKEIDFEKFLKEKMDLGPKLTLTLVSCATCGAEVTLKPEVVSDFCPFCQNPVVVHSEKISQVLQPQYLLPFDLDAPKAHGFFKKWISKLWFAPSRLKKEVDQIEKLKGIYLPYWTYDAKTVSEYKGQRGTTYTTTRKVGNSTTVVTQVRWVNTSGVVAKNFDDVLVCASKSLPVDRIDKLEPWDTKNWVTYDTKYLSGFQAEKYQMDVAESFVTGKKKIENLITQAIKWDIGGDHQRITWVHTSWKDITFKHVLLPVWVSAYRFQNKVYQFLVNARTGEVQGTRPYSIPKIIGAIVGFVLVIVLIVFIAGRKG